MAELCFGDLQFSASSANLLGSDGSGRGVFKGTFKGQPVAVKQFLVNSTDSQISGHQDEQHWEKLLKFRDNNLVQYLQCRIEDDVRYLVMELCQGSMLDYCRKTLDESVASYVKAIDVMWQITCGLDYLHRQKIHHGDLKLENVLFRKRDSKSKRVVVKLAGYGCKDAKTDLFHLGCLFYSAATKEEAEPNGSVPVDSLTEIDVNHRELALDLISLLVCGCLPDSVVEAGTILRHPLFTRCTDEGRSRLIEDSLDDKMGLIWNDKEKMQKWLESMDEGKFPEEDFDDFKDIVNLIESETKDTHRIVREAFKITPQLFSEYVWHTAIGSGEKRIPVPKSDSKPYSIELQEELGKGTYGTVYKCDYTAGNGNVFPAACKKCKPKPEAEEVFSREIETLRKLNHLFIVRYLDAVEKDSAKFIVMELCEGSLKEYIEGKLESIPKDSLDEKILIGQVALGLAYIHDKGIIHKDLKLANILLKRHSLRLVLVKMADFGLAKELKPGKSEFSETEHPGTETYMAPELLSAPDGAYPASFASDVYALGITIARIVLKGKHPFSSNEIWRKVSMVKGLVPQNLEGLSWDLIDLILKLTDKDPGKRPNMFLVLLHPYFILTNDRTKRHFVNQFRTRFQELVTEENKKKQKRKIFNNRNFREWYETLSRDKPESDKEIEEMTKNLKLFSSFIGSDVKADSLYPTKEYEKTIKEAIASEYDANVGNKITQMNGIQSYYRGLSQYRLYQLIQRTPKLLVPYFWFQLQELDNESLSSVDSMLETSENQKSTCRKRRQSSQRKLSEDPQHGQRIISELEWISYYYGDEEVVDELWNVKYTGRYKETPETVEEIIKIVAKCNVSERVWSVLLDRFGDELGFKKLLLEAVTSFSPNAPKVTDMILHRWDETTIKEKISLVDVALLVAACNEGDWAAEIMQVLLKHGGHPNFVHAMTGHTPVHNAAMNESHSAPKIIRLLLQNSSKKFHNFPLILDGFTPVHLAAFNQGDYAAEILKQLIDSGGTCNAVEKLNLFEPIHYATVNSGDSAVQLLDLLLVKRGINVLGGKNGETLLHLAMLNEGDCGPKILKKLLESGINPNVVDKRNWTPLHMASASIDLENQNIALMRDLLENGGDPNAVDDHGRTPVHYAATDTGEHGYEKLKLLLDYKGDASIKDEYGQTLLHYAVFGNGNFGTETRENTGNNEAKRSITTKNNQIERVQLILANGGNANAQDNLGRSSVHIAVTQNELEILQLLLKKGGNPNLLDKKQFAPIHFAADSVSETAPEMMKILLEYGGNANLNGGEEGVTPLHLAAKNLGNSGNHGLQLTEILLEHGGNSNVQDNLGRSPVHIVAAINECNVGLEILKLLLNKGGDPNLLDKEERCSPLHCAANGHKERGPEKIKILLEYGGDPNLKGGEKVVTPLHIACMNSEIHGPTITRILLENGANPNALDFHKRTPLHLAIQQKEDDQLRLETIKLLLEKGANPNAGDKEGRTPVHYVVKNNRSNSLKMLKLLLENGGNILQKGNNGASPYLEATQKGNKQYCHPEVKKCIVRTYRKMK